MKQNWKYPKIISIANPFKIQNNTWLYFLKILNVTNKFNCLKLSYSQGTQVFKSIPVISKSSQGNPVVRTRQSTPFSNSNLHSIWTYSFKYIKHLILQFQHCLKESTLSWFLHFQSQISFYCCTTQFNKFLGTISITHNICFLFHHS